jgi:hypothetical protein
MKPTTAQRGGTKAPTPATRPFRVGVQSTDEVDYDDTRALTTSTQDLPPLNVPPAGFLQNLYVLIEYTVAGNAVATVAVTEDYPWNLIDTIQFDDVNNASIFGPFTGWDAYIANKYGGYTFCDDPRHSPVYRLDTLTGTNATASSTAFVLRIPVELVQRDGLGALPNKSGTAMFKVKLRLAASGSVYTTPPTTLGTVRTRIQQADWWEPDATDLKGRPQSQNPPAVQTTQYWSKVDYTVNAGSVRQKLDRVGYLIRNLIFVARDSSATTKRANGETNFFDPFMLRVEGNTLITRLKKIWLQEIANWGYLGGSVTGAVTATPLSVGDNYTGSAAAIATQSKDNGVYVQPFCADFAHKPGWETRRGYLATAAAARVEVQGTLLGGGTSPYTLTAITNDVSPVNGDDAAITV